MTSRSGAFSRYLEAARNGRTGLWRILLGTLLIVAVYLLWSAVLLVVVLIATGGLDLARPTDYETVFQDFLGTRTGIAWFLASFIGIWGGVWLAVRLLHRRRLASVLGTDGGLWRRAFVRTLAAGIIACGAAELAGFAVDPTLERGTSSVATWLAWLVPMVVLVLAQTSAEELMFRGYLLQSLAARYRSPWIWGVVPAALFTLLHGRGDVPASMLILIFVEIGAFAAAAAVLTWATGTLGASMGLHLSYNLFALLLISNDRPLSGLALFTGRFVDSGGWGWGELLSSALLGVLTPMLALALVLHPRSPLRIAPATGLQLTEIAT